MAESKHASLLRDLGFQKTGVERKEPFTTTPAFDPPVFMSITGLGDVTFVTDDFGQEWQINQVIDMGSWGFENLLEKAQRRLSGKQ